MVMVPKTSMFYIKQFFLLLFAVPVSLVLNAQGQALDMTYYQTMQKGERLHNSGNYQAAYQKWDALNPQDLSLDQKAQRAFNMAYLGLLIGYKEAPVAMRRFVRDYPSAPEVNRAYTMVGHYYFTKAQYANALTWYQEAKDFNEYTDQDQYEMAYAHFELGHKSEAARFFAPLVNTASYGARALYYLAFIEYQNKNWQKALTYLAQIDQQSRDELQAWGLMADLAFRSQDYAQAAAWGIRALDGFKISGEKRNINQASLNGIIGRAYGQLGAHGLAVNYLEESLNVSARHTGSEEHFENLYYLGQSYAALGQFQKVIDLLSQVKNGGNLSQKLAYVLAGAYLALDQKTEAMNAYKKASEPDLGQAFAPEAHYQYAKITYDLRLSYTSVPQVLESFFKRYPEHPKRPEVEQWWLSSLLESQDYNQVISYLSDTSLLLPNELGNQRMMALQRAHFLLGLQHYDLGHLVLALDAFEKAQSIKSSTMIAGQARFWSGVIQSESGAYQKALDNFGGLKKLASFKKAAEYPLLSFEMGYAFMALKDYDSAQSAFLNYLDQKAKAIKENEARLSLADCYFATKQYALALIQYEKVKALGAWNQDYADYQGALCLEFTEGLEAKAQRFARFLKSYPNSVYLDEVHHGLGSAYVNLEKIPEAEAEFKTLISNHKNSPLAASAYLNLGLIADNKQDFEQALHYFKSLVDLYPGTQEAISAVQTARNTFISLGRVKEYGQWVNALDFVSVEDAVLDQATFESAKQAYTLGNHSLSIQRFDAYLENYPQGRYTLEAHYFLSEIYWRKQNAVQAMIHADPVINADENPSYVIPTLIRVARHYLSIQEYETAEPYLRQLLDQPLDGDQRTFALSNLMQISSEDKRWQRTNDYAQALADHLTADGDAALLSQARLNAAWSYFELGAYELSREQYQGLEEIAQGQYGAQFALAQAYFAHLDKDYAGSNVLIQNLAQNYANYGHYATRGLLLMAANFEALSDPFQAQFILENIRDNVRDFPELQQEAIARLSEMERQENSGLNITIEQDSILPKIKNKQ